MEPWIVSNDLFSYLITNINLILIRNYTNRLKKKTRGLEKVLAVETSSSANLPLMRLGCEKQTYPQYSAVSERTAICVQFCM